MDNTGAKKEISSSPSVSGGWDSTVLRSSDSMPLSAPSQAALDSIATEFQLRKVPEYTLSRLIGSGGFGEVWESTQPTLSRVIAVKKLHERGSGSSTGDPASMVMAETMFLQEALTTAALEHPNIVPVYDLGRDSEGKPLLSMKLVRGERWDILIQRDMFLPMPEFLERHLPIFINMCQAVAFAHSRGVIHRDLKPAQVMVGEFGEAYLMDWGLAVVVDEEKFREFNPQVLRLGVAPTRDSAPIAAGTPAYMAPEQTRTDMKALGPWTDVFLLGSTLYYLLTGKPPYMAKSADEAYRQAEACVIEAPWERVGYREIPHDLGELCMKALRPDPAERIPSARLFAQEVQHHLTGAGKRRESVELTQQAQRRLFSASGDYRELAECESLLTRALGLWPENPNAEPLRQRVLNKFAEAALDQEDLKLARVMAARLSDAIVRDELIAEITAHEKLQELQQREAEEAELERRSSESAMNQLQAEVDSSRARVRDLVEALIIAQEHLVERARLDSDRSDGHRWAEDLARIASTLDMHFGNQQEAELALRLAVLRRNLDSWNSAVPGEVE